MHLLGFNFQTLTSFLLRKRLGGKGYQPDADSPLTPYVKGFGELTDLTQKLTSIIEEVSDERLNNLTLFLLA